MTELLDTLTEALGDTYAFERELAGGGMSRLFLARERQLDRKVVVKVLSEQVAGSVRVERFRREIQVSARLQHPHIVPVLSTGEIDGIPYYVMPFIEGESLRVHLERSGDIPVGDTVRLLTQIASALAYAHKNGVVHRDIKPDNVLLSADIAVVTDFGIAKALSDSKMQNSGTLTIGGLTVGTPAYMAPEQALAEPGIDHRADIYSFGVVAYEMLAGGPLFATRSQQALMAAHAITAPEPLQQRRPTVPSALARLVMQCLEKRPEDRPQTAQEVIQRLADAEWSSAERPVAPTRLLEAATPSSRGRFFVPAIAAGILALSVAAYLALKKPERPANAGTSADLSSIAVLPLVNVGGNSSDEYFSEGMTDELANALNKLPGMRIASRTSAYSFKNRRDVPVTEIGKQLNVQAVVEGTVRRAGGRLRVTAQLTSVADGLTLWSDTYERQASDVFAVQEDVARSIAEGLKPRLGVASVTGIAQRARGTENLQAYDIYLRGKYYFNRRGAENLRESIKYLEQAIAADPNFARAYATLATASALLPEYTDAPSEDVTTRGRAAATRALSIDGALGEANAALGLMALHDFNFKESGARYRAAIMQEPDNPTAQQWYGEYLYHTGQVDSALVRLEKAEQLDPFAPIIPSARCYAFILARRFREAIEIGGKGVARHPDLGLAHEALGMAYLYSGETNLGVREIETASRLDSELVIRKGELGYAYGRAGRTAEARQLLQSLKDRSQREKISQTALAEIYLGLKDYPNALLALEKAIDSHDISLLISLTPRGDPMLDPLRAYPKFLALLERMHSAQ